MLKIGMAAALVVTLGTPVWAQGQPPVIHAQKSAEMDAAIPAARASLPSFWSHLDNGDPDRDDPMVKVAFTTSHGAYYGQFTTRVLISNADTATRRQLGEEHLARTPVEPERH